MKGKLRPRPPANHLSTESCPHRPPCPGCPRFGESGIAPQARSKLDALAHTHGLAPITVTDGATQGFRLRGRLAIRGRLSTPKLGLFELDTHRVVHIPNCSVQHPLINRVSNVVRRALVEARIPSYSDDAHLGLARYLQVVIERNSQTAQVVLVGNSPDAAPLTACFELIRERLGTELHSLWFNSNCEQGNAILGRQFMHISGPESVVEHFGGAAVHYPPGAFGQNNLDIAQSIIEHIRTLIPPAASVTEFYAGVGAIGLSVLERVAEIRLNEVAEHSLHGLELGLAALAPAERAKASIVPGAAGVSHLAAQGSQVVIADPPRKGLDPELTKYLRDQPPQTFIYVSCGLDSFLNDTDQLLSAGKLRLASLTAFNLIPYTEHVETVASFERDLTAGSLPSAGRLIR